MPTSMAISTPKPALNGKLAKGRPILNPHAVERTIFEPDTIEAALQAYRDGEFVVVMDDEGRENECDVIIAASECTTEKMAWMIKHSSGFICVALPAERLEELEIPMMYATNEDPHRTAYAVTCDFKHDTTTGISAHDRSLTARSLSSPLTTAADFTRPGHIVPLRANPGGVLARRGHTEAAIDLCLLSGLPEKAGILCELVEDNETGSMMRRDGGRAFADRWGLKMITVEQLVQYRLQHNL